MFLELKTSNIYVKIYLGLNLEGDIMFKKTISAEEYKGELKRYIYEELAGETEITADSSCFLVILHIFYKFQNLYHLILLLHRKLMHNIQKLGIPGFGAFFLVCISIPGVFPGI